MGLWAWLNLKGSDVIAFAIANLIGFFAGRLIHDRAWATYTMILVSYHLFLGWLVFSSERETGFSLPVASTLITHLACVFLIVALGVMRGHIPFFRFFRYAFAGMAVFERWWLFTGKVKRGAYHDEAAKRKKQKKEAEPEEEPKLFWIADHESWLRYRATAGPGELKLGQSVKDHYNEWMRSRAKARLALAASKEQQASESSDPRAANPQSAVRPAGKS